MKIVRTFIAAGFALMMAASSYAADSNSQNQSASTATAVKHEHHEDQTKADNQQVVNINTASASDFTSLKGIGEKKAEAIVQYRTEHGNFKTVDDLDNVKGINKSTIDKNRERLTVG